MSRRKRNDHRVSHGISISHPLRPFPTLVLPRIPSSSLCLAYFSVIFFVYLPSSPLESDEQKGRQAIGFVEEARRNGKRGQPKWKGKECGEQDRERRERAGERGQAAQTSTGKNRGPPADSEGGGGEPTRSENMKRKSEGKTGKPMIVGMSPSRLLVIVAAVVGAFNNAASNK